MISYHFASCLLLDIDTSNSQNIYMHDCSCIVTNVPTKMFPHTLIFYYLSMPVHTCSFVFYYAMHIGQFITTFVCECRIYRYDTQVDYMRDTWCFSDDGHYDPWTF